MELIKQNWTQKDFSDFLEFEKSLIENPTDCEWEQRIVNTKLNCVGRTSTKAKKIANQIKKGKDKTKLEELSKKYLSSEKPFVRRVGVNIYFALIEDQTYLDKTFEMLNSLKNETEYYVNMSGAWLLSECYTKHRDKTLNFFKTHNTNAFIINKGISKCRDSFRVSKDDKEMLIQFKVKEKK